MSGRQGTSRNPILVWHPSCGLYRLSDFVATPGRWIIIYQQTVSSRLRQVVTVPSPSVSSHVRANLSMLYRTHRIPALNSTSECKNSRINCHITMQSNIGRFVSQLCPQNHGTKAPAPTTSQFKTKQNSCLKTRTITVEME